MAKKKKRPNANQRREKVLDHLLASKKDQHFLADLMKELQTKDEQTLRRDLEHLTQKGLLSKEKDESQIPARSIYKLDPDAAQKAQALRDEAKASSKKSSAKKAKTNKKAPAKSTQSKKAAASKSKVTQTVKKSKTAATAPQKASSKDAKDSTQTGGKVSARASAKQNMTKATSTTPKPAADSKAATPDKAAAAEQGGRRSARELEANIISALEKEALSAQGLAQTLSRQRPTIVKALERLQKRGAIARKKSGRSYFYYVNGEGSSPAESTQAAGATSLEQLSGNGVQVAVNTLIDRLLASERRRWELESKA